MRDKAPAGAHPVRVHLAATETEANLIVGFLEEKGIPARVEDPYTRQAFAGVDLRVEGEEGIGILVSSDDEVRAASAVAEFRARPPLGDGERVEEE